MQPKQRIKSKNFQKANKNVTLLRVTVNMPNILLHAHFFSNLNNKQDQCHTAGLHITLTIIISLTTIAPHSVCLRCTASASAVYLILSDIVQMSSVEVCQLAHLLTTITEATLCTMPCLCIELIVVSPLFPSAQPQILLQLIV